MPPINQKMSLKLPEGVQRTEPTDEVTQQPSVPAIEAAAEPQPSADDPPIKITDEADQVRDRLAAALAEKRREAEGSSVRPTTWDEFEKAVLDARKPPEPPPYNPPKPTATQQAQIDAEMEAGRKRSEFYAEQERLRPKPEKDPAEGVMQPVPRNGEYQHESRPSKAV